MGRKCAAGREWRRSLPWPSLPPQPAGCPTTTFCPAPSTLSSCLLGISARCNVLPLPPLPPPPADQVVHSYILNSQSGQTHELATSCINSAVQTPDYREYQKIHPVASLLIPGRSICRLFPNEVLPSGASCSSLHLPSQCAAP